MTDGTPTQRWSAASVYPDMWVDPDKDPRDTGKPLTDERSVLVEYLRAYRLTFEMKCADLDAEQMAARSVPPSTMSLLGLLRHLAKVERHWFRNVMAAQDLPMLYSTDDDRDADFNGAIAAPDLVNNAWDAWQAEVRFADHYIETAPDLAVLGTMKDGSTVQLREVLVHMIEEYARHCGHADLLRERVDGRVGQ